MNDAQFVNQQTHWLSQLKTLGAKPYLGPVLGQLSRRLIVTVSSTSIEQLANDNQLDLSVPDEFQAALIAAHMLSADEHDIDSNVASVLRQHPDCLDMSSEQIRQLWRSGATAVLDHYQTTRLSQSTALAGISSPELEALLIERFSEPVIQSLKTSGRLSIVSSASEIPADTRETFTADQLQQMAGVTLADGSVYLLANKISKKEAVGIFLHEIGEHAGMADMLGADYSRLCAHFDHLLTRGDSYAHWAADRVPLSTPIQHVSSERLAYLVEAVANDHQIDPLHDLGGQALGNDVITRLRAWIFKSSICKELENENLLGQFTLAPSDIAELARQAVNHVAQVDQKAELSALSGLSDTMLSSLAGSDEHTRQQLLTSMPVYESLAYLYALTAVGADNALVTVDKWRHRLHECANDQDPSIKALSLGVLDEARRLANANTLIQTATGEGMACWKQYSAAYGESLYLLTPSDKYANRWEIRQYQQGLVGTTVVDQPSDVLPAIASKSAPVPSHFIPSELKSQQVSQPPTDPSRWLLALNQQHIADLRNRSTFLRDRPQLQRHYQAQTFSALSQALREQKEIVTLSPSALSLKADRKADGARFHLAYHGTRHSVGRFSLDHVGAGEGNQSFGYGLYFAQTKMVAKNYQVAHLQDSCFYENTWYPSKFDMAEDVVRIMQEQFPETRNNDAAITMRRIAIQSMIDPAYTRDLIADLDPVYEGPMEYMAEGIMKATSSNFDRFTIMPAAGVRALREIYEHPEPSYRMGLHELECAIHWNIDKSMSDQEKQAVLDRHVARILNVDDEITELEDIERQLDKHPEDSYLLSRQRDINWSVRAAEHVRKLVTRYPSISVRDPQNVGTLYAVEIDIKPHEYLNHDKPFSAQSEHVKVALNSIVASESVDRSIRDALLETIQLDAAGAELLGAIAQRGEHHYVAENEQEKAASMLLHDHGIQGIEYADGITRYQTIQTMNYVIFDDSKIEIVASTQAIIHSENESVNWERAPTTYKELRLG